ncbi:uncharacterized protein BDW47DRAFT_97781 [Aspergillus candidus]|uniref:Uncharacterized protein n=1 Tax=Aspergillus candidus TaxID=41067 RepID=A0A2I2FN72_ASPCN|nr:hypothetical protein BDW47DRAFT_97781 [Aspergillus candidus]PLB42057.1 hypothetical protein BDW47DRAFT_97781 [Aspergillus candidus]
MMVPRAFLFTSVPSPKSHSQHGRSKPTMNPESARLTADVDRSDQETLQPPHADPVVIPPKRSLRLTPSVQRDADRHPKPPRRSFTTRGDRPVPPSVASILEATAIPVPRRSWTARESRKLPRDHVQDFSRFLMDGVGARDDHLLEGTGNSTLDLLLSPPEDNDKGPAGNEDDSEALSFSGRSTSSESMPSLDHDVDTPSSFSTLLTPHSQRSHSERRYRRTSRGESCAFDHPLLETEIQDSGAGDEVYDTTLSEPAVAKSPTSLRPPRSFPGLGSFRSNLTASLRAIKSAAQTMSRFTTPASPPDDFLPQSLFTINPEMTDDRRPPPMNEPPSPALRRYLNPVTISPAEMYAYQDYPHETLDSRNCPVSVQMQTYHRTRKRGSRKSGFHLPGDGRDQRYLPFNPESLPVCRQREPRENSNFLRVIVLEMNMRRCGKLRDDIPTRARVWLPPRQQHRTAYSDYEYEEESAIPSRWVGITVNSV